MPQVKKIVRRTLIGARWIDAWDLRKEMMRTKLKEPKIKKLETRIRAINNTLRSGRLNLVSKRTIKERIMQCKMKILDFQRRWEHLKNIDYDDPKMKRHGITIDTYLSNMMIIQAEIRKLKKEMNELNEFLESQRT